MVTSGNVLCLDFEAGLFEITVKPVDEQGDIANFLGAI